MADIPADLVASLAPDAEATARRWWASLSEADRERITGLWDSRLEATFFSPQADADGRVDAWDQVPVVRGGRFVPPDDAWGLSEWGPGYFEHLLQHPELMIAWEPEQQRVFHICKAHAAARACLEVGRVPEDFACPMNEARCPLRPLRGASLAGRTSA